MTFDAWYQQQRPNRYISSKMTCRSFMLPALRGSVPRSASNETTALLPAVMPTYGAVGVMPQSNPAVDMVRGRRPYRGGGRSDTRYLGTFPKSDKRCFRRYLSHSLWGCRDHPTKDQSRHRVRRTIFGHTSFTEWSVVPIYVPGIHGIRHLLDQFSSRYQNYL